MLLALSLRDFVIVENLNLDFQSGFTVLTGETGAQGGRIYGDCGRDRRGQIDYVGRNRASVGRQGRLQPSPQRREGSAVVGIV